MTDAKNSGGEAPSSTTVDQPVTELRRDEDDAPNNAPNPFTALEDMAASKSTSNASSTRNSTPAAASIEVRQSAQDSYASSSAMEDVQPSKDSATNAPHPAQTSSKESEPNGEVPSSYGTRSRNRPGRSRPNYAEDTEMDFEVGAAPTNGTLSDPPSRNSVAPDGGHSSGVSGKKGSGSAQGNASWGNSGSNTKDNTGNLNIPGASASASASASTATTPSTTQPTTKRRKNAAANATNGSHASAAPPSQTNGKRGNHAMVPQAAQGARESNMLTFENTGAFLKNGCLEADDGQTVHVNGKW